MVFNVHVLDYNLRWAALLAKCIGSGIYKCIVSCEFIEKENWRRKRTHKHNKWKPDGIRRVSVTRPELDMSVTLVVGAASRLCFDCCPPPLPNDFCGCGPLRRVRSGHSGILRRGISVVVVAEWWAACDCCCWLLLLFPAATAIDADPLLCEVGLCWWAAIAAAAADLRFIDNELIGLSLPNLCDEMAPACLRTW